LPLPSMLSLSLLLGPPLLRLSSAPWLVFAYAAGGY
jgi:hypothetical protein